MYLNFTSFFFEQLLFSRSPDEIHAGITLVFFFFCYTVAMRDFLCKVYDKLYCFVGYADMRLILGYESGGKGCARISFYIRGAPPPISLILYATWYFFHDSCTSEYNLFYSDIQVPRQEPTNPDPDLSLHDQP